MNTECQTFPLAISPFRFCAIIVLCAGLIYILPNPGFDELSAVGYSLLVVTTVWVLLVPFLFRNRAGWFLYRQISCLLALKLILSTAYFYFLFLPVTGFKFLNRTTGAPSIDVLAIHTSAVIFLQQLRAHGTYTALFGEYYRSFNNPGVAVFYGLLYKTFGAYPGVAIPWNVLWMGLAGLIVASLCHQLSYPSATTKLCVYLTLLMPSFLVLNPLYRDQLMLLLILLIVYGSATLLQKNSLLTMIAISLASALLTSLRLSFLAFLAVTMTAYSLSTGITRWWRVAIFGTFGIGIIFVLAHFFGLMATMSASEHFGADFHSKAHLLFGNNPFSNLIFVLLTPFPWYQDPGAGLLVYQFMDYPQVFLGLCILSAAAIGIREIMQAPLSRFLALTFFLYLLIASVSSGLHQRYVQIAMPLMIIPAGHMLVTKWRQCIGISAVIIIYAHVLYEVVCSIF